MRVSQQSAVRSQPIEDYSADIAPANAINAKIAVTCAGYGVRSIDGAGEACGFGYQKLIDVLGKVTA